MLFADLSKENRLISNGWPTLTSAPFRTIQICPKDLKGHWILARKGAGIAGLSNWKDAEIEVPAPLRLASTETGHAHVGHAVYARLRRASAQPAPLASDHRYCDGRTSANRRGRDRRISGAASVRLRAGVADRPRAAARVRVSTA